MCPCKLMSMSVILSACGLIGIGIGIGIVCKLLLRFLAIPFFYIQIKELMYHI